MKEDQPKIRRQTTPDKQIKKNIVPQNIGKSKGNK